MEYLSVECRIVFLLKVVKVFLFQVSTLDIAKSRVVECMQRVSDLMDLRTCAQGVNAAMDQEDYELAAQHIHKFLTLDTAVFQMGDKIEAKG